MMKGIYTPLSGAVAQERVMEIISNNLANINTTGFKGENVTFTVLDPDPQQHYKNPLPPANYKMDISYMMPLRGNDMNYVGVAGVHRDLVQGPVVNTQNPLDMMIGGEGFFTVMTDEGARYTRDGSFSLNADGVLATKQGHPVLGERGNVYLRSSQFEVNARGEIYQDGQFVDRLMVQKFADERTLERVGHNLYFFNGDATQISKAENITLSQGQLEGSNVNAIKNMTAMILAHRSYEAYQKAVSNYDGMLEKSSNTIGEIRA